MSPSGFRRPGWMTTTNRSRAEWLARGRAALVNIADAPLSEAQSLLGHALGQPREALLAHPELPVSEAEAGAYEDLLARRTAGEPLPYLLGRWEFYGMDFAVTPDVLIPRPETELLVDTALDWLRTHPGRTRAADVGTGSGCIAAALARHAAQVHVLATDRSAAALRVAKANFGRLGLAGRVTLAQMDVLGAAAGPLDLVCANLPYIPTAKLDGLDVARHEPRLALDGGADGLALVGRLLADAPRLLAAGGLLLLEVEAGHGQAAPAQAARLLPGARVALLRDLAGLPRLLQVESVYN